MFYTIGCVRVGQKTQSNWKGISVDRKISRPSWYNHLYLYMSPSNKLHQFSPSTERERERAHPHPYQDKLFLPLPPSFFLLLTLPSNFSLFLPLPPCHSLTLLSLPLSQSISNLRKIEFFLFCFLFLLFIYWHFLLLYLFGS